MAGLSRSGCDLLLVMTKDPRPQQGCHGGDALSAPQLQPANGAPTCTPRSLCAPTRRLQEVLLGSPALGRFGVRPARATPPRGDQWDLWERRV